MALLRRISCSEFRFSVADMVNIRALGFKFCGFPWDLSLALLGNQHLGH